MRPPPLHIAGRYWRVLSPRWAHAPLSGEGAKIRGGRWNPKGTAALYMSATLNTAVAEYQQDIGWRPGTFVAYDVDMPDIADLTDAATRHALDVAGDALLEAWKHVLLVERREPACWTIVRRLLEQSFRGAVVPSAAASGGRNLVLWQWDASSVQAFDPNGDLPPMPG